MQNYEIQLHDIKPLMEIHEYSLYYFIALICVLIIIITGIIYFIYKWYKIKNAINIKKEHLKILENLDINNTKEMAYKLSYYGATFQNETQEHRQLYKEMLQVLEKYKYKKYVNDFDKETQDIIDMYLEKLHV